MKNNSPIRGVQRLVLVPAWLRFAMVAVLFMLALLVSQGVADVQAQYGLYAALGWFLGYGLSVTPGQVVTGSSTTPIFWIKERDL